MALVALPLVPVVLWLPCHFMPSGSAIGKWARRQRAPQHIVMRAVKENGTEPFVSTHWHWAAVLALQRLVSDSQA